MATKYGHCSGRCRNKVYTSDIDNNNHKRERNNELTYCENDLPTLQSCEMLPVILVTVICTWRMIDRWAGYRRCLLRIRTSVLSWF
jgi:hypothetical protein